MEQNVSMEINSVTPTDHITLNALEWKDGIATLPGSNLKFRVNEFGQLEIITEVETEVAIDLSVSAVNARPTTLAPAAIDASAASSTNLEVPRDSVPCSNFQTCEQMDCVENGKFCTQTDAQQHKDNGTGDVPDGYTDRADSRNLNTSNGWQVNEADRVARRLHRKRKHLPDFEYGDGNADKDEEKNKSNNMKSRRNTKPIIQVLPGKKVWNWVTYLEEERMPAAPLKLFREYQSFPQGGNGFSVGLKLEGLDPEHPSRFCVLTVAEVKGYRVRLHFDGYPECYDFWVNADSSDIYPVGWCESTSRKLLPPKGLKETEFNWTSYLKNCNAQVAPKSLFKTLRTVPLSLELSDFQLGMKVEAVNKKKPLLMCVATIMDKVDNRLLIHLDNWDETYNYWCEASSLYIRPVGYCQETGTPLTPPPGYKNSNAFSWEKYLDETHSQAAPATAFKPPPAHEFQVNTKLEVVDRRNPILIRVATIVDKDNQRIKIRFDGWDSNYDLWVWADCPDIHPVGWCEKTGHPLQVPPGTVDLVGKMGQGCPTPGCHGIGHVKGSRYGTHHTLIGCPYSEMNLKKENILHDRLAGEKYCFSSSMQKPKRLETPPAFLLGGGESSEGCPQSRLGDLHTYAKYQQEKQQSSGKDPVVDLQQALHQSFMPSLISNPTHRLHLFWKKYCKLLPEISGLTARHVASWTVEEVVSFVQRLPGCKEVASVFREEIDGEAFLLLNQNDMTKILNIKLGPALKIYNAILMFHSAEDN